MRGSEGLRDDPRKTDASSVGLGPVLLGVVTTVKLKQPTATPVTRSLFPAGY